ncbi:hypothetical protein ABPG75_011693 [Micractinium tetrahymenae]
MSYVQVGGVPTSASPGELRTLFEQCGAVRQLVCWYEAGAAEGTALVAFADRAAAQEAADLLDSYPLGTSLLEVQPVNPDRFVGRLVSGILAARFSIPGQHGEQPAAAASGNNGSGGTAAAEPGGVAALEAEMRELQLQLQQQADSIQAAAAAAVAEQQQQGWGAYSYGAEQEAGAEDEWQQAVPRARKGPQASLQQQQAAPQQQRRAAGGEAAGEEPNTGLWVGWIGLKVTDEDFGRAFSRWGPVHVERLQSAEQLADNGKRYKWGILRFKDINHAIAAKHATHQKHLPGITADMPLKVVFYKPGHVGRGRGKP